VWGALCAAEELPTKFLEDIEQISVGRTCRQEEVFLRENHALTVRSKVNWTAEKLHQLSDLSLSPVNKRHPPRNQVTGRQAPQRCDERGRPPFGNLSFETLQTRPKNRVNRNLSIAFPDDESGSRAYEAVVAAQIPGRIQSVVGR